MMFLRRLTIDNHLWYALKIGIGSGLSIYLAELLQLEYSSSAGIITLLTIASTKRETLRLGLYRIMTFLATVFLCWLMQGLVGSEWISYGIVMVVVTFFLNVRNLLATLSVNAVVVSHLLHNPERTINNEAILNELLLLAIGLVIAIVVNYFQNYESQKKYLEQSVKAVDLRMQRVLTKLAAYLRDPELDNHVWEDIIQLEKDLLTYAKSAFDYQQNRRPLTDDFYVDYFEMRLQQCSVLHNLHYEIKKIRVFQSDSQIIADFLGEINEHLPVVAAPKAQLHHLDDLVLKIQEENLPESREEFVSKARLYHILMDLEEFLKFKQRFVAGLETPQQQQQESSGLSSLREKVPN